jgi:hypothetical protein
VSPAPNAFDEEFLQRLNELDEPYTSLAAEFAGPLLIRPFADGYGLFLPQQAAPDVPLAFFTHKAAALKFAAAIPAAALEPRYRQSGERTADGVFPVLSPAGEVDGWIRYFLDRAVDFAQMAHFLATSPPALAALLEAAGPDTLRKAGEILLAASQEEPEPQED